MNLCTLGAIFVLTLFPQSVRHRSPLVAGLEGIPLFAPLAINNTTRQAGGAIGIAIAGAIAGQPSSQQKFTDGFHTVTIGATVLYSSP
jgi:hypothetical protein